MNDDRPAEGPGTHSSTQPGDPAVPSPNPASASVADGVDEKLETVDGCGLEAVDETPDEDLPITEGGVA